MIKNSNLADFIFRIQNQESTHQELNFSFIYNNYKSNETLTPDNVINSNLRNYKDKFIRVEFESRESVEIDDDNYAYIKINILRDIENIDLNENYRVLFNKHDNLYPNRKSLHIDNKIEDFKKYYDLFSLKDDKLTKERFFNFDKSRKISIAAPKRIQLNYLEKDYVENYNFQNIKSYKKVINDENTIKDRRQSKNFIENYNSGELFPGIRIISQSVNSGDVNLFKKNSGVYCGIYIEKFIKKNSDYNFLCSKFYTRPFGNNVSKSFLEKIEDTAIKYGETYRYVCYNVYFYTKANINDRFVLDHFLFCDHPYISSDIICKEFDPPPPPVGLTANYDKKNKHMTLSWESPSNYEDDVKGFQILKRLSINEPYSLVAQLEGHNKDDLYEFNEQVSSSSINKTPGHIPHVFIDDKYDVNKECFYTIRSIDAHGMTSNYSAQIGVYYDHVRDHLFNKIIAYSGADVLYPNSTLLLKSFFSNHESEVIDNLPLTENPKKIELYITPDFNRIINEGVDEKVLAEEYQFTFSNIEQNIYKKVKIKVDNFI